jgi:DNA-binding transcriptional regulator YdaS (Cro superfamily)
MINPAPTPIERAAKAAGGVDKLAEACGVSVQAVYKWLKQGHPPVKRCVDIERAAEGAVNRFDLLPQAFAGSEAKP